MRGWKGTSQALPALLISCSRNKTALNWKNLYGIVPVGRDGGQILAKLEVSICCLAQHPILQKEEPSDLAASKCRGQPTQSQTARRVTLSLTEEPSPDQPLSVFPSRTEGPSLSMKERNLVSPCGVWVSLTRIAPLLP